ncbi:hypothetical protein GD1_16 [Paraglaciecola Antarctic GD virus 1]|nr:hypothetical protein GD1_16 [Paraglaciecola Antarctic GD virus 1]
MKSDLMNNLSGLLKEIEPDADHCKVCKRLAVLNYATEKGVKVCCHECRVASDNMENPKLLID